MERIEVNVTTGEQCVVPLTPEEIAEILNRPKPAPTREEIRAKRIDAYKNESDPWFFKAQRGEATMDDWRVMVASIQLTYPYPDENPV